MAKPERVIIAAVGENLVIGDGLRLPWHIPTDLKRFKRLTLGHPLIMGRRTFESLVHQFNGPLPNRRNIVLTRRGALPDLPEIESFPSIETAFAALADEPRIFIGGGADIYAQTLADADRWELTIVEGEHAGDVFFPPYEHLIGTHFTLTACERHEGFRFETYHKQSA